jgi:hypothetical protein
MTDPIDPAELDALPGPHVFVDAVEPTEDREPRTVTLPDGSEVTVWWAPALGTWVTIPEDD